MKRHEALQPLSRFHRSVLFLALVAKPNGPAVKGYPTDHEGKVDFALSFYHHKLVPHFTHEETQLYPAVQDQDPQIAQLVQELLAERRQLKALFAELAQERPVATLNEIGLLLEKHVRKEERQLFQKIQDVVDEEALRRLQL